MKIKCLFLFIVIIFFAFVPKVMADYEVGSLRYNIESVVVSNNKITISGYAFIHRRHNYVTVYERTSDGVETDRIIKDNGGQKVAIRVKSDSGKILVKEFECENDNYNFYYQMFNHTGWDESYEKDDDDDLEGIFSLNMYNNKQLNDCDTDYAQCYYEDLGFKISFTIDELLATFSADENLHFEIAAFNNDNRGWTNYETLKVINVTGNSPYIEVVNDKFNGSVKIFAYDVAFQKLIENSRYEVTPGHRFPGITGNLYRVYDKDDNGYINGFYKQLNIGLGGYNFLNGTYSPGKYVVCVNSGAVDACSSTSNNLCNSCPLGNHLVSLYGSWVEPEGNNRLIIKVNGNSCDVTTPSNGPLECNENKTFNSKCDNLTVVTSQGNADVTIEQTGYISSILTPLSTYAGGGINFDIMYYNTIRWDYAPGVLTPSYHNLVVEKMNSKLKDYENYINNINISELMFNNKLADINMVKKCSTNKNSNDYYQNELVTICVFSFPLANISLNGDVTYNSDVSSFNVNNKYYTPMNYNGNYKITADIVGMDRITDNAAKNDSKESTKWTGDWSDTFTNCQVNLYTLISGIPKFIYRPIDINNPFPNRNAGINWYDWYNITRNKERLENTYSNLDYTAILDNKAISDIKNYNKMHNYLEWDSINEVTKESSFITEKNYMVRGGN